MSENGAAAVLIVSAGIALALFYRLHRMRRPRPANSDDAIAAGLPAGAPVVPLGEFAVQPGARWLVLPRGM